MIPTITFRNENPFEGYEVLKDFLAEELATHLIGKGHDISPDHVYDILNMPEYKKITADMFKTLIAKIEKHLDKPTSHDQLVKDIILSEILITKMDPKEMDTFLFCPSKIHAGHLVLQNLHKIHGSQQIGADLFINKKAVLAQVPGCIKEVLLGRYKKNIFIEASTFFSQSPFKPSITIYLYGDDMNKEMASQIMSDMFKEIDSVNFDTVGFHIEHKDFSCTVSKQLYHSKGEILYTRRFGNASSGTDGEKIYFTARGLFYYIYGYEIYDYMKLDTLRWISTVPVISILNEVKPFVPTNRAKTQTFEENNTSAVTDFFKYGNLEVNIDHKKLINSKFKNINVVLPLIDIKRYFDSYIENFEANKDNNIVPYHVHKIIREEYESCLLSGDIFPTEHAKDILEKYKAELTVKLKEKIKEMSNIWVPKKNIGYVENQLYKSIKDYYKPHKIEKTVKIGLEWSKVRLLLLGSKDKHSYFYGLPKDVIKMIVDHYNLMFHVNPVMENIKKLVSFDDFDEGDFDDFGRPRTFIEDPEFWSDDDF